MTTEVQTPGNAFLWTSHVRKRHTSSMSQKVSNFLNVTKSLKSLHVYQNERSIHKTKKSYPISHPFFYNQSDS